MVNIGIISYNRLDYTKQCIAAIKSTILEAKYKITVVDNGSDEETCKWLKSAYKEGLIDNLALIGKNIGVAKASNVAWKKESGKSDFYLKLDNDMIAQKSGWLEAMIKVYSTPSLVAVLGYNVEPTSYPVNAEINGYKMRIKPNNIGGACLLIPRRTEQLLGYFCEDYAPYGEEDADYFIRVNKAGKVNAYMEDEDMFFHLPAGKAAVIDVSNGCEAKDGLEEVVDKEYRAFKDSFRAINIPKLMTNYQKYNDGSKSICIKSNADKDFRFKWVKR